jgi:hypothetical protein
MCPERVWPQILIETAKVAKISIKFSTLSALRKRIKYVTCSHITPQFYSFTSILNELENKEDNN